MLNFNWGYRWGQHRSGPQCHEWMNMHSDNYASAHTNTHTHNTCPWSFIRSVTNSKSYNYPSKEDKSLGSVYIPHVKEVSETFKHIRVWHDIRTIFRSKHTLRSSLTKTRTERNPQHTAQCVYSIPTECGRSYTGDTGKPLTMQLHEQRCNFKDGLLEISKLAQHSYDGRRVLWDEGSVLEIESNSRYRKYNERAHMTCLTKSISQPSLAISPIRIPLFSNEVTTSKRSLWHDRFFMGFVQLIPLCFSFHCLCGLGVRLRGCRPRSPGFDSWR
jgi:hypothetical protein